MEAGANGFEKEIENRATLLGAGRDDCPDPFEPALASFASRSLRYMSVDDHEANGLLGQIVGRLDAGRCDKPDVTLAVFLEATGEVPRLRRAWDVLDGCLTQHVAENLQRGRDRLGLHEVPAMDHVEHRSSRIQNATTVRLVPRVGMLSQPSWRFRTIYQEERSVWILRRVNGFPTTRSGSRMAAVRAGVALIFCRFQGMCSDVEGQRP